MKIGRNETKKKISQRIKMEMIWRIKKELKGTMINFNENYRKKCKGRLEEEEICKGRRKKLHVRVEGGKKNVCVGGKGKI